MDNQTEKKYSNCCGNDINTALRRQQNLWMPSDDKNKSNTQQIMNIEECGQKITTGQQNKSKEILAYNDKSESFSPQELRKLFDFYDQYGPKWSNFQQLIPGRTQNQLKNKFHSTIRTLARLILSASGMNQESPVFFSSSRISSKLLIQFYQGKKCFKKYKHFMKKMLTVLQFDINKQKEKIQKCRATFGVALFCKMYQDLLQLAGSKAISHKQQKKNVKKKIKPQQDEKNPLIENNNRQKYMNNVDEQNKKKQGQNVFIGKQRQKTSFQYYKKNSQDSEAMLVIRQNNFQIMQKLLWINQLHQMNHNFFCNGSFSP